MGRPQNIDAPRGRGGFRRRIYKREFSVYVDVRDNKAVKALPVIDAIERVCGEGSILACVPRAGNLYEVTMTDETTTNFLLGGLECEGKTYECTPVGYDKMLVSFLDLSVYIPDHEIMAKLDELNVEVLSPITRKRHPGRMVEDGTRMCTVKLPAELRSLPYFMKLSDGYTTKNYRVVHDNQQKMCNNCFSTSHLYRECPEITCFRCKSKGHFKWQCQEKRCGFCYKYTCECKEENENAMEHVESDREEGEITDVNIIDDDHVDDEDDDVDDNEAGDVIQVTNSELACATELANGDVAEKPTDDIIEKTVESVIEPVDHTEINTDGETSVDTTPTVETRETLFGDILSFTPSTVGELNRESPQTRDRDKEKADSSEQKPTEVEMCSPRLQRKRPCADDSGNSPVDRQPTKLRVQSPEKT